jgi:hypothetical protein
VSETALTSLSERELVRIAYRSAHRLRALTEAACDGQVARNCSACEILGPCDAAIDQIDEAKDEIRRRRN